MSDQNRVAEWDGEMPEADQGGDPGIATTYLDAPQYDLSAADPVYDPAAGIDTQADAIMYEAVKRIEQANLYQTILKHDMFAPGSARPEIIEEVQKEFRTFALERLEKLLGMKSGSTSFQPEAAKVEIPFDDEQVDALKALANRALKRDVPVAVQPQLNPVAVAGPVVPSPAINVVQPKPAPVLQRKAVTQAPQRPQPPQARQAAQAQPRRRRRSNNVSAVLDKNGNPIVDKDYSQAIPEGSTKAPRPKPMPSQMEQNMMHAATAQRNEQAFGRGGGADPLMSKALSLALTTAARKPDDGG
jgi:hypothetical protein